MISWTNITGLGDTIVTLPAALAITGWLFGTRAWRMALCWCLLFGLALTLVLATKIAFVGWGIGVRPLDFTGISGHAMRACAVLPVMAYLMVRHASNRMRIVGLTLGCMLAAVVGLSRIVVHAHSVSETLAGCLLGAVVSLCFIRLCHSQPPVSVPRWLLLLGLVVVLPTSQAEPAPTHQWVNGMALYLSGHQRPYERDAWLAGCRSKAPAAAKVRM